MRKFQTLFSIVLLLSILLSACGSFAPASIVKIGWSGEPSTLNPGPATLNEEYSLFFLIYDSLYQLNLDGTYSLELAETVDVSDDQKVWTFKIRDGVKFHDGKPLTAEDVAFSFNFYEEHGDDFVYLPSYTSHFKNVVAAPDNKVVITLDEAIPNMESQLYSLFVLPKHIWGNLKGPDAAKFTNDKMIGSGPFRFVEFQPGKFIQLEAVRNHYLYHPKVGGVKFVIYKEPASMIEALRDRGLDAIVELPLSAVPALRDLPNVEIVSGPPLAPSLADVIFNQISKENCPTAEGGLCTGHPALRDRNVRLAMAYATKKQKIIDDAMLGLADPGLTLIPEGLGSFYNSSIKDYAYDVEEANNILDEAGYLDKDGDNIREMPDGTHPLIFRLEWPDDLTYGATEAQLLKVMWGQIGIGVRLQQASSSDLTARCCPAYDYDVLLWDWGSDPDPNFLLSVMLTSEIPTGYNETGYSNPIYDDLYNQQAVELDHEKRLGLIWQMQEIVFRDVVYIVPFYAKQVQAYRSDTFRGWLINSRSLALDDLTSLVVIEPVQKK